eukprot:RCo000546
MIPTIRFHRTIENSWERVPPGFHRPPTCTSTSTSSSTSRVPNCLRKCSARSVERSLARKPRFFDLFRKPATLHLRSTARRHLPKRCRKMTMTTWRRKFGGKLLTCPFLEHRNLKVMRKLRLLLGVFSCPANVGRPCQRPPLGVGVRSHSVRRTRAVVLLHAARTRSAVRVMRGDVRRRGAGDRLARLPRCRCLLLARGPGPALFQAQMGAVAAVVAAVRQQQRARLLLFFPLRCPEHTSWSLGRLSHTALLRMSQWLVDILLRLWPTVLGAFLSHESHEPCARRLLYSPWRKVADIMRTRPTYVRTGTMQWTVEGARQMGSAFIVSCWDLH